MDKNEKTSRSPKDWFKDNPPLKGSGSAPRDASRPASAPVSAPTPTPVPAPAPSPNPAPATTPDKPTRSGKAKKRKKWSLILLAAALLLSAVIFLLTGTLFRKVNVVFDCNAPAEETFYEPEPQRLSKGDRIDRPPFPARDGYKFTGWYTDSSCEEAYSFDTVPQKDLTLYARWVDIDSEEAKITEEDWAVFNQTEKSFSAVAAPFEADDGYVPDSRKEAATDAVEQRAKELLRDGVLTYVSRERNSVYVEFASCLSFIYYFPSPDDSSSGLPKIVTMGVEPFVHCFDTDYDIYGMPAGKEWVPLATMLADDIFQAFPNHDRSSNVYRNHSVNYLNLRNAECADIILWDGHGNYDDKHGPVLLTDELLGNDDYSTLGGITEWELMTMAPFEDFTISIPAGKDNRYIALTPAYFEKYFDLDDALVYLSACNSGYDDDNRLADAFHDAGADVVFFNNGTDSIKTWYTEAMMTCIIRYMTGQGRVLRDGIITNETDGIYHNAADALLFARAYMTIFSKLGGVEYQNCSFFENDDGIVEYQNTRPALSKNSDGDYTICSGIHGTLISSDDSIDLSKVELLLTGQEMRQPDIYKDGEFYFNDLPTSEKKTDFEHAVGISDDIPYKLTISYEGEPLQVIDDIFVAKHHFTPLDKIDLSGNCLLSVTVTDERGNPLPNAVIEADNGETVYHPAPAETGDLYRTMVQMGKYTLHVSAPGYAPQEDSVRVNGDTALEYQLEPAGSVSGAVMRADNQKPLRFLPVTLVSEDGTLSYKANSSLRGKYSFGKLPPGNYVLSCKKLTYTEWQQTVRIDPDETVEVRQDIAMERVNIGMAILKFVVGVISLVVCGFAIFPTLLERFSGEGDNPFLWLIRVVGIIFFAGIFVLMLYMLITGQL